MSGWFWVGGIILLLLTIYALIAPPNCYNMQHGFLRDSCLFDLAVRKVEPEICGDIQREHLKGNCTLAVSEHQKTDDYCNALLRNGTSVLEVYQLGCWI
jgi:hypothetical protein